MNLNYLQKNVDITHLSNFRTKAISKYYFELNSIHDIYKLKELGRFCEENNLKILFIGKGTNLLFAFDEFNGVVVVNKLKGWKYDEKTKILEAYSNELISLIALKLQRDFGNNIWHRFIGLPGTIGGAVFGNAGCFGLEAENNFLEAEIYNIKTGQLEIFNKQKMQFSYRNSHIKQNCQDYFIISVKFDLSKVIEKYSSDKDVIEFRKHLPKGFTCGSFFKNPSKEFPAGKLIEEVSLKGYKIGGAYFSEKHANFLMSDGTATYKDLLDLMNLAIEKVKQERNIELISEVRIIY